MWATIHSRFHSHENDSDEHRGCLKLVDKMCRANRTTRSAFIREALKAQIRRQRVRDEEMRHAEGYARKPVAPGEFDVWLSEQDWGAS